MANEIAKALQPVATQAQSFIDDPRNRAMLQQFGVSMLQPIGFGQDFFGHLGQGIASGLEARDRQIVDDRAEDTRLGQERRRDAKLGLERDRVGIAKDRLGIEERRARV